MYKKIPEASNAKRSYAERCNGSVALYKAVKTKMDALRQQKEAQLAQADAIEEFMFALSERGYEQTEFDESFWIAMVQKATAYHDERLVFTFQNGVKI